MLRPEDVRPGSMPRPGAQLISVGACSIATVPPNHPMATAPGQQLHVAPLEAFVPPEAWRLKPQRPERTDEGVYQVLVRERGGPPLLGLTIHIKKDEAVHPLVVEKVDMSGEAARLGIRPKHVILSIQGKTRFGDQEQLQFIMTQRPLEIILMAPTSETLKLTLKYAPSGGAGFKLEAEEPDGDEDITERLVVNWVRRGGSAAKAGLKVGDTLVKAGISATLQQLAEMLDHETDTLEGVVIEALTTQLLADRHKPIQIEVLRLRPDEPWAEYEPPAQGRDVITLGFYQPGR